jgi:hypothetical protein
MKCSCVILTYNEADRIRIALSHAPEWCDDVVVVDKHSTDGTADIARVMGARVEQIPFSKQGFEDVRAIHAFARHEWSWLFTPGEVPTRKLIETGLALTEHDYDGIIVPMRYYSFGIHNPASPWGVSGQPRLIRRDRVTFTGIAHDPIRANKWGSIPYGPDSYVLHQTHATAASFMRAHVDYMEGESKNGTPDDVVARALYHFAAWDHAWKANGELAAQSIAWKTYWLGVALYAIERKGGDVPEQYAKRAEELLGGEWSAPPL